MGMFDTVIVECELPDSPPKDLWWQTKDLSCGMDKYKITADGRLMEELYRVEDRSDPNAKGLMALRGCATRVNEGWKDLEFHGILRFYASTDDDQWFEYNAKFTDGKLVSFTRIPDELA